MKFEETLVKGITVSKNCEIFEKYATEDRIYALWSQFLSEHNKLMQGKDNNAYSCIRAALILLSLADEDMELYDTINSINFETKVNEVEFLKLYLQSLIDIKEKYVKCYAFKDVCLIAYNTLVNVAQEGEDFLDNFKFDIFEDFKTVLLAEELEYNRVIKKELLNVMLYCDEFNEIYNYDTNIVLKIMEDVVDDDVVSFKDYDDYIATELHQNAHNFLEDYLEECTMPYKHDTLTENNYEVLILKLAHIIEQSGFAWLVEHAELEDGYYKVSNNKLYKGYVGTILYKGVYYDFDTDSNDIVARQENVKGEFSVVGGVIDLISAYYETKYYN